MHKIVFLTISFITSAVGQETTNKEVHKRFDQSKTFKVLKLKGLGNYPSSDPDTSYCEDWDLTIEQATAILKIVEPITGPEWHHLFGHYPCVYEGTLKQDDKEFEFEINGGSWLTITSDTTIYYGDLNGTFEDLFIDKVLVGEDGK